MRKTPFVLAVLLAVAGTCVMLWPVVTGYRLQANTDEAVQSFLEERKPEQQYPELLAALQEYNRQLYAEKQSRLIDLEACEEPAADLTAYGIEDEVIGVLEIPAMELTMPVYLGASDDHLAAGAAVLGNTSAPVGGDNTNCVIASHRGWRGADYFRHIDRFHQSVFGFCHHSQRWRKSFYCLMMITVHTKFCYLQQLMKRCSIYDLYLMDHPAIGRLHMVFGL